MKTIILTRHAKSSWKTDATSDFERPLNKRGIDDAPVMAKRLQAQGPLPQLIVSSTATRALQTSEMLMTNLAMDKSLLTTTDAIYEAPARALIDQIKLMPADIEVAMMVGHNPGISELVSNLCGEHVDMPTAALAHAQSGNESWKQFESEATADLVNFWRPKELN